MVEVVSFFQLAWHLGSPPPGMLLYVGRLTREAADGAGRRPGERPLAAVVTFAHMPGFLYRSIGAQYYCGHVVGPGKPLEAIFAA